MLKLASLCIYLELKGYSKYPHCCLGKERILIVYTEDVMLWVYIPANFFILLFFLIILQKATNHL